MSSHDDVGELTHRDDRQAWQRLAEACGLQPLEVAVLPHCDTAERFVKLSPERQDLLLASTTALTALRTDLADELDVEVRRLHRAMQQWSPQEIPQYYWKYSASDAEVEALVYYALHPPELDADVLGSEMPVLAALMLAHPGSQQQVLEGRRRFRAPRSLLTGAFDVAGGEAWHRGLIDDDDRRWLRELARDDRPARDDPLLYRWFDEPGALEHGWKPPSR